MKTTLNKIKEHSPCNEGWNKLLTSLSKTEADNEELSILHIIESNGIEDAIWALRAVEGYDRKIRLFAVWCARQVQHLMTDDRSASALDVAERYANGLATRKELAAAWAAAWDADWDAARAAARDAAWDAAWDAARSAAWAAAWAAARAAARDAAWDAARDAQKNELIRIINEINSNND